MSKSDTLIILLGKKIACNKLSLSNYLETLVIITFLSFAIGLYWRFKFRSRYLAAELEETRYLFYQASWRLATCGPFVTKCCNSSQTFG